MTNVLRASVTSENIGSSPGRGRRRRAGRVTLVAYVTAAHLVSHHDAVDAPRRREEGSERAGEGVARQVRGGGAHAGAALRSSQPHDVPLSVSLSSKLTSLLF